jgi:hypothetical protein
MSTAAQIAANQLNAQLSTGPKTDTGKAASSANNLRFGFTGAFRVMPYESQPDYESLLADLRAEHNPATITQEILVAKMAEHYWTSRRAALLLDHALNPDQNAEESFKTLNLFLRYQTTHDRAFHKCLAELRKLRAEKRKAEIGFESQKRRAAAETVKAAARDARESRCQAAETRKQEAHESRTRVQTAKAEWQELNTEVKGMIQAILPGHTAISFEELKPFLQCAVKDFVAYQTQAA